MLIYSAINTIIIIKKNIIYFFNLVNLFKIVLSSISFKDKIYIKIIDFINNFLELYKLIA